MHSKHKGSVGIIFGRRHRRWASIIPAQDQHLVLLGEGHSVYYILK